MTFQESIATCFMKYADFDGRASRSEYWWFVLFLCLAIGALGVISQVAAIVFQIAVLVPFLAAGTRRLQDTNRSGWLQLFWLVPFAGAIVMIVFLAADGKESDHVPA